MANYCDFSIHVYGDPETLARFTGYFTDSIKRDTENERQEVYVPLNDGTFGDLDEDKDVLGVWLERDAEIQRLENGDLHITGWCKWNAPIRWLEQVSNLMPGILFAVKATIEHELYQEWKVSDGCGTLTLEKFIPLRRS